MNVDIMYVKGIPFLLNILTLLRIMFAAKLKSKTIQLIFATLTGQISDISARGFKRSKLRCDPEGGFTAMKDTLSQKYGDTVDAVGSVAASAPHRVPLLFLPLLFHFLYYSILLLLYSIRLISSWRISASGVYP